MGFAGELSGLNGEPLSDNYHTCTPGIGGFDGFSVGGLLRNQHCSLVLKWWPGNQPYLEDHPS